MINHIRPNWLIYETDITHLGGTLTYTKHITSKSHRSSVQKALITLDNQEFSVDMERFKDGTAAVVHINNNMTNTFIESYKRLTEEFEVFHEHVFLRFVKQMWLFICQLIMIIIFLTNIYTTIKFLSIPHFITAIIALSIAIIVGGCYSRIRCHTFSAFLKDIENDEKEDNVK